MKIDALAAAVDAMPGLAALEQLWTKQPGESEVEYLQFLDWLDRGEKRGSPPKQHMSSAAKWDWARRAMAYERAEKLTKQVNSGEADIGHHIVSSLTLLVKQEVDKLLRQSSTSEGGVTSLKDITAVINLVANLQKKDISHRSSSVDLSKLTKDELETVLKAQQILKKASGK